MRSGYHKISRSNYKFYLNIKYQLELIGGPEVTDEEAVGGGGPWFCPVVGGMFLTRMSSSDMNPSLIFPR